MRSQNNFFPTDPKKLRDTIRRYERAFKAPHYDDGPGKRFLLGPLYLLMSDIPGALKSYEWYEREFPDDVPEAFNHLCWVLTLLKSEKIDLAKLKLRGLIFENLYIIPILLGEKTEQHPFKHSSNWSELSYVVEGPCDEIFSLCTDTEKKWIRHEWENPLLQEDIRNYIELYKVLSITRSIEDRQMIISQADKLARGL
jgi:hypothetical protein